MSSIHSTESSQVTWPCHMIICPYKQSIQTFHHTKRTSKFIVLVGIKYWQQLDIEEEVCTTQDLTYFQHWGPNSVMLYFINVTFGFPKYFRPKKHITSNRKILKQQIQMYIFIVQSFSLLLRQFYKSTVLITSFIH